MENGSSEKKKIPVYKLLWRDVYRISHVLAWVELGLDRLESRVLSLERDFAAYFRKCFVVDLGLCVIASSVLIFVWKAVCK